MFLARGLCLVITDRSIAIDNGFFQSMNLAHINLWEQETVNLRGRVRITDVYTTPSVLIALAVLAVAFVVLHYSRFGRTVYAVGGNEPSARLMGLRVDRTKVSVYVISGLCAGIAGLLFAFYTASGDPVAGIGYELNAIAAVVIGGTLLSGGSGLRPGVDARRPGARDNLRLQGIRRRSQHRLDPGDDRRPGAVLHRAAATGRHPASKIALDGGRHRGSTERGAGTNDGDPTAGQTTGTV